MSHPNPYLFQISRMGMHVRSWMDITSRVRSYRCRILWISRMYFYVWMSCIVLWFIRTWLDVNIIHSVKFYVVYFFNVSSINLTDMLGFLDKSSMGVTLLLLSDCQFDIVYPDILLCFSCMFYCLCFEKFSIVTLSMFSCISSHPKCFSYISSHLKLSLIKCMFLCILLAKIMEKGILVISCIQIHFNPWKLSPSLFNWFV
jgi:hypothetical protein